MRFSIITITFNAQSFLEENLKSIKNQTFKDFEHLIWDGGSSDETVNIARSYGVKIFQGKDKGIADAMNLGAARAQGEILLHLHADDLLADTRVLERVHTFFNQYPDIPWMYGQVETIDAKGKSLGKPTFSPFSRKRLEKYNCIAHPATFIKKDFFEKNGGFDVQLRYCMDYDLWLRLSAQALPLALPMTVSFFRQHPGSLSTANQLGVADEAYFVRNRYVKGFFKRVRSYRTWKKRRKAASAH